MTLFDFIITNYKELQDFILDIRVGNFYLFKARVSTVDLCLSNVLKMRLLITAFNIDVDNERIIMICEVCTNE